MQYSLLVKISFIMSALLISQTALANEPVWQCSASDAAHVEWHASSNYQKSAINRAYSSCKKESEFPQTCKTSHEACEEFINGKSTRPMWHCIGLDQMAKEWQSNYYRHRDDAAIAARAYCKQNSSMPNTCYVNLLTCKNVNE